MTEMPEQSDLSKKISELANTYGLDAESISEKEQVRSLVQGCMVGFSLGKLSDLVKVADVEQEKDAEGIYEPFFIIETESGIRLRISVDVEP